MHMKRMYKFMIAMIIVTMVSATAQSQDVKTERITVAYMIAMGRKPSSGELNYWKGQGNLSVEQLVENHRQYLAGDKASKRAMIIKAFKNSYGRNPSESEIATNMNQNMTYAQWMNNHLAWLKKSSGDYVNVIKNSYKTVFGREPNTGELNFWKSQPVMSHMILAACHEDWKRKNGNTAKTSGANTIGTSSSYVDLFKVGNEVANEASKLIGPAGGNVIAPGGGNVVSSGGGNVVAAGGMN
jgi:hypothetical protein